MDKTTIISIAFMLAVVSFAQIAHAGTVLSVTDAVNINGSIGLYLKNELGITIKTDSTKETVNVVTFFINGSNTTIDVARSASELPKGLVKLVVLNAAWPSGGHYNVNITYRDAGGGFYPEEHYVFFAKPPLILTGSSTNPTRVLSNNTKIIYTTKLTAAGEADVSNINFELLANPKYYTLSGTNSPGALSKGANSDIVLTFERDGQSFPDTVVYTTVFVPMKFTYKTMGFESSQTFNDSFVLFSSSSSVSLLPKMNARIAVPEYAEKGNSVSIPIYIWNSNVGGHSGCSVNATLAASSSDLSIPISTILPGTEFKGRIDEPEEPAINFTVNIANSTASGDYKLTLTTSYQDCEWKSYDSFVKTETLSVKKAGEAVITPPPAKEEEKKPVEHIVNLSGTEQKESKGMPAIFTTLVAVTGVILLFIVIYFLELRSRTVF